jgi:tripartite-type tricarboxylate transporter receptor subunit TctC
MRMLTAFRRTRARAGLAAATAVAGVVLTACGGVVEVTQYRFMTTPKGTPQEVKDKIVEGMKATFATEDYKSFNMQNSLTPMEQPGDEVLTQLQADQKRYADLIKQYGINLRDEG